MFNIIQISVVVKSFEFGIKAELNTRLAHADNLPVSACKRNAAMI